MEKIIDFAAKKGKVIELNANPHRLDLDWRYCDAHNISGLYHIDFGINIARKGWLEPSDCINCLNLEEMKNFLSTL